MAALSRELQIYDRSVSLETEEDIDAFLNDPEGFLRALGALDGLPEFRGIKDLEGADVEKARRQLKRAGEQCNLQVNHIYGPVMDFCYWRIVFQDCNYG